MRLGLTARAAAWIAPALLIAACATTPDDSPQAVVLRVFELGRTGDPDGDVLDTLFGPLEDLGDRARLLDAIEALGSAQPEVVAVEPLETLDAVAVDLSLALQGGGEAAVSFLLERHDDHWRVRSFHGPGTQWPSRRPPPDDGLTTSPPPLPDSP